MKRPIRELIVGFIHANPNSNIHDICESVFIDHSNAYGYLASLVKEKMLVSKRCGRENKYQVNPAVYVESKYSSQYLPADAEKVKNAELKASELMANGLPRRAATVLTEAIGMVGTESDVRRIARMREECLKSAKFGRLARCAEVTHYE
ncbi:hypothetical protein [Klebsiella aerogenes]|uniref:hypothetical protein n=1 Tax=Klebsiella aerogenes TaxID=548 RepID=UPI001BCEF647|nr:hypothetical protein [Klebsiella aerogenes]